MPKAQTFKSSYFVFKRCCQSVLRFDAWCSDIDYFSSFLSVVD